MMAPATAALKAAILQAMPAPPAWLTSKQVYERLDFGAYQTVRNVLNELAADGKLAKFGPLSEPAYQRIGARPSAEIKVLMAEHRKALEDWKRG